MAKATPKPAPVKTASPVPPAFVIARRVVKGLSLAVGGFLTIVSLMSVAGLITGNGWVRFIVALVIGGAMSAFAVDRLAPKGSRPAGWPSDIVALVLLAFAFLFVGVGQPLTKPILVREADRMFAGGFPFFARAVYFCAGVRPAASSPTPGTR